LVVLERRKRRSLLGAADTISHAEDALHSSSYLFPALLKSLFLLLTGYFCAYWEA
jgi:hypothetical protein